MTCPVCKKSAVAAFAPFCSERCKMVDLNKWFSGSYSLPVVEMDDLPDDDLPEN